MLLAAGSAAACNINDFSVGSTAQCDISVGVAKAAITITDKDASGTPADITVYLHLASGESGREVGSAHIAHPTGTGVSQTILVDWLPGYSWDVHVKAGTAVNQTLTVHPASIDISCGANASSPSAAPSHTAPASSKPSPASVVSTSAAPSKTSSATPSAAASGSPKGSSLAFTGGGDNSGLIAGLACAIIAAGGGVLFALRRRGAAGRH